MKSDADSSAGGWRARWRRLCERRLVRWGLDLLVALLLVAVIGAWQARHLLGAGEPAPPVRLEGVDGRTYDSADWAGRPTLLVFWAPWCGVCGAESDNLSRVRRWLGDRVNVVSVAVEYEDRAAVDRFIEAHDVDYPVLLGDRGASRAFRVSTFPTLYVLDAEGRIEHTVVGYTTTLGMLWRLLL